MSLSTAADKGAFFLCHVVWGNVFVVAMGAGAPLCRGWGWSCVCPAQSFNAILLAFLRGMGYLIDWI